MINNIYKIIKIERLNSIYLKHVTHCKMPYLSQLLYNKWHFKNNFITFAE